MVNSELVNKVRDRFILAFDQEPLTVRAPGRINLIGEHTDYNDGFVLPAAVSQSIYFAVGRSTDGDNCTIISLDFDETFQFDLDGIAPLATGSWQNYILGVVSEVQRSGLVLGGFQLVFAGDVPLGSGMSSSAALECGAAFGLNALFSLDIKKLSLIKMAQSAEHKYAGVRCGIMDQFTSLMGKQEHALLLDCRSLEYQYFPVNLADYSLLLINSNISHSLASSEYNVRRRQCEEGVALVKKVYPNVVALRDVSMDMLNSVKETLSEVVYLRCKYVIEENDRVKRFAQALSKADMQLVGAILQEAHIAMRYEYEITCPEIDFIVDMTNEESAILGARMMGGGFGGCVITLIQEGKQSQFLEKLNQAYQAQFGLSVTPVPIQITDGVSQI